MKVRQDAWSHEDDLLLAETVLRYIRDGGTQLAAFEEVGDALNRTSAACGFRWNAEVRKKYEPAVAIAKKQRKEKKRAQEKIAKMQQKSESAPTKKATNQPLEMEWLPAPAPKVASDEKVSLPFEYDMEDEEYAPLPVRNAATTFSAPSAASTITLDDCIHFLQNFQQNQNSDYRLQLESDRLLKENQLLKQKNQSLEKQLKNLEEQQVAINEDYEMLVQIMDRARRLTGSSMQDEVM
ncbi:RsfA family transcriptional regulator [Sutcliffiella horikoshii]|uniref:RsfA family transcriptional regulator n=1 Tax=Sutcliffiella horikoshii TaxID=79883 RepID=A0ABN4ZGD7_9BACI|nr:RsfA family transcriptional regulator [Sutcliffiella horikoshii]ART77415.1 RsfA family transcriptional regulator [Sutcliffiella horikoshii]